MKGGPKTDQITCLQRSPSVTGIRGRDWRKLRTDLQSPQTQLSSIKDQVYKGGEAGGGHVPKRLQQWEKEKLRLTMSRIIVSGELSFRK